MICLTQILFRAPVETRPVLLNPKNITYIHSHVHIVAQQYNKVTNSFDLLDPPLTYPYSCISFTAGLAEESDSIFVIESLEELAALIRGA